MIRVNISADSDLIRELAYKMPNLFGGKVAPATKQAVNSSVRYVQSVWQNWAMGDQIAGVPNIKSPSSKLAQSIKVNPMGPFMAEVYSESPYMQRIVDGTPQVDMKETYPFGRKSRVSKDGIPYLIVPFRWGTPDQKGMPRAHFGSFICRPMFKRVKKLDASKRLSIVDQKGTIVGGPTHAEANYSGEPIERSEYEWGDRLEAEGNMGGMVRMGSETKRGGSTYFTFRVISAKQFLTSPYSWIKKAVPPVDVVGALEKTVTPVIEDAIQAGLEADLGI